ncbi:diaminopimelate epimerase [uncultured Draconibacterium sp.]|uniref:diaminopimelate epimerase n=1 Tax=uncultured Draconibacterium sp. TaxID=1573823 RepID=UPI002AA6CCA3|nr:diaminopimelate epimerase [uncultured Draconibacterium sp.]
MQNFFVKSHGLGNDYIVLSQEDITFELTEKAIIRICDVHFGIGSDGILLKVPSENADFGLRILNPDGSEAEKSGNGLRIFAKYLYDHGFTSAKSFSIETPGGLVHAEIVEEKNDKAFMIKVDMGKAIFEAQKIPVNLEKEECIDEALPLHDKTFQINCVSVGNPHCVVLVDELYEEEIKTYGSDIENHPMFPNRINVQFAKVISRNEVEIMIWERGAGWTLASGSSSCAVACTVLKRGLTDRNLTIKMPGGELAIEIDEDWEIRMTGEVREIGSGTLGAELIQDLEL